MRFNSFFTICTACMLLTGSLSAFALNEQIKCPSADFLKSNFASELNEITRVEVNRFVVKYWGTIFDAESHRYWSLEIFADTADDYDFNEAFKNAQATLTTIVRPRLLYTDIDQAYCDYLDANENSPMVLAFLAKEANKSTLRKESSYREESAIDKTADKTAFPFQNVALNSGGTLQSAYSFKDSSGNTHPIIFCFQGLNGNVSLTWPYKGKTQSGNMPIQLKTNSNYEGSFADLNGTLTVTNNSSVQQFVSCQYGF